VDSNEMGCCFIISHARAYNCKFFMELDFITCKWAYSCKTYLGMHTLGLMVHW
jgi:hypothetical protein